MMHSSFCFWHWGYEKALSIPGEAGLGVEIVDVGDVGE
jgi:hypothetical protein